MKTTLLIAAGIFTFSCSYAQKVNAEDVPATVKEAFSKHYPGVKTVEWEKENSNYEVEFDLNKTETSVLINEKGNIVETEMEININALPAAVLDYCAKNYTGKIKEAAKITDEKGIVTYEAEINEMDILFSAEGKFIKESSN